MTLQIIFNDARDILYSPTYRSMCEQHLVIASDIQLQLESYDSIEGAREVREDILDLVGRVLKLLEGKISL
jgi:hypothetical protein